jgi:hypothetical protein
LISSARLVSIWLLAILAVSACASQGSATTSAKPADVYSITPTEDDVRSLLTDSNWWEGPPTFQVLPLDSATQAATVRYSVTVRYLRLGTAEEILARYTVYDKSSSASTAMSNYQTALGTSPPTPKVGDQILYYGLAGSGATPLIYRTFVRVGQVVVTIVWARKDRMASQQGLLDQLAKNARKFTSRLKDLGKIRPKVSPVDSKQLPPPGLDITLLGSAMMPVEAFASMIDSALPDPLVAIFKQAGINTFPYGDYALNNDTHMEVQTALLTFGSLADADAFAKTFGPGIADQQGVYSEYIPTGGSPAAGKYHYVFASGIHGVYMVCKSSIDGEAASRECEAPMKRTATAWNAALQGVG